ncbi:MAG: archease [Patescibacteria group bacterium]|nr:archease [Patescibacteria group bacterium]
MEKYKKLEHPADLRLRVFGRDMAELFQNALFGMFESIEPDIASRDLVRRKIQVQAGDPELLLVDFLSEALLQSDTHDEAYHDAEIDNLAADSVTATLIGYPIRGFRQEIKAVTYHGFKIEQTAEGLTAEIIFDI